MTTDSEVVEIVERPATLIAGIAGDFTMDTRQEIPKLWHAFFSAGYEIPERNEAAMYGVSFSMDGKGGFRYGVGVSVTKEPAKMGERMCMMHLSEGPHAVLRAFGSVTELPAKFDHMFGKWLPSSGHTQREGAVFERYPEDERNGPEAMAYEIWVPVNG